MHEHHKCQSVWCAKHCTRCCSSSKAVPWNSGLELHIAARVTVVASFVFLHHTARMELRFTRWSDGDNGNNEQTGG